MTFSEFLIDRLRRPLPGTDAHLEFVPPLKDARSRLSSPPDTARKSAVLVPLIDTGDVLPSLLLEIRTENLSAHKGQMSFPGGRMDNDETPEQAAIRELNEELGVNPAQVHTIGRLSPIYIPPSNSAVTPVIATVGMQGEFTLSEYEVADVLMVPISHLADQTSVQRTEWSLYGTRMIVPHWNVHPTVPLWGATAMIINELLWLTREYQESSLIHAKTP